jgi:hypothetical protein
VSAGAEVKTECGSRKDKSSSEPKDGFFLRSYEIELRREGVDVDEKMEYRERFRRREANSFPYSKSALICGRECFRA